MFGRRLASDDSDGEDGDEAGKGGKRRRRRQQSVAKRSGSDIVAEREVSLAWLHLPLGEKQVTIHCHLVHSLPSVLYIGSSTPAIFV